MPPRAARAAVAGAAAGDAGRARVDHQRQDPGHRGVLAALDRRHAHRLSPGIRHRAGARRVDASFDPEPAGLLQLFLIILPVVLLGATVLTALAAFARSYREAQAYLPLLMFLPMIPSLMLMVAHAGCRTQLWMLAVPFLR